MSLAPLVKIASRFQRAIKIDTDLGTPEAIEGFICPQSSANALLNMVRQISKTGQCAFTWTGPYGSGKSSLLVALGSLLSGNKETQRIAAEAIGDSTAKELLSTLPPKSKGWKVLPIVGRRDDPIVVIGEALHKEGFLVKNDNGTWTAAQIIEALLNTANDSPKNAGGLIVFIDEMGKILEGAASKNSDIYFFQQLAEAASRSQNRLILIGVLHQAFGEYAHRLSRESQDEWSKIQGRFIDLPINVAGEEQIDLLSRAIASDHKPKAETLIAKQVASVVKGNKRATAKDFPQLLDRCWPLHPLVACLLGPISRRRFGQNQRSLFGFLNSAEPSAFNSFLDHAEKGDLYGTDQLWDYLRINLEPTILTSPDGHRWSLSIDAVERCEAQAIQGPHLQLLKAIALIDLFKASSGLMPSEELLIACFNEFSEEDILNALDKLGKWSLVIFKKHLNAYAIFAGSDFDIEEAIIKAREEIRSVDFKSLKRLAGLQPILAKRHYHKTGVLRWFDVDIVPISQATEEAMNFKPENSSIGQFLLTVSTENETQEFGKQVCTETAQKHSEWDIIVGISKQSWTINTLALEILALEKVYEESEELAGDAVARREIRANLADLQGRLESELNRAFDQASWFLRDEPVKELNRKDLSVLVSELADKRFKNSPKIHNELLNRIKPSSNAISAQNALLNCMANNLGESRLGIEGFPAWGGLYASILEASGLYDNKSGKFQVPTKNNDPCNLAPAWESANKLLEENHHRSVALTEIYDGWKKEPLGIKDGLMPILAVSYILSNWSNLAFYREGLFQSSLKDLDVEVLAKLPADIQLRHMDLSEVSKNLLSGMADIVRELDECKVLINLEPIDVARGLISIYDNIHPWAQGTQLLSKEAKRIRIIFKKANDPNKLIFNDIPNLLGNDPDLTKESSVIEVLKFIRQGLIELKEAYPTELNHIRELLREELQLPNLSPSSINDLRERSNNIDEISGDLRLNSFVTRLSRFTNSDEDIEGIGSLAVSKPPRNWIDNDLAKAKIETIELARNFIRMESFARVKKGIKNKRQSVALITELNGLPTVLNNYIMITDNDREQVKELTNQLREVIPNVKQHNKNIILAALTELCAQHMQNTENNNTEEREEEKAAS